MMKYAWPVFVLCSALLVAAAVLTLLNLQPGAPELPHLVLRDSRGQRLQLETLRHKIWIASFISAACLDRCPSTLERLAQLHDGVPEDVRLVTFVVDGAGLWPPRPAAAADRPRWVLCQGNAVDADDEAAVRSLATDVFGFDAVALEGLRRAAPGVLVATIDRTGRARGQHALDESADGGERAIREIFGDVEFLVTLNEHPLRHAGLNALTALLLVIGLLLIRRKIVRGHLVAMALATATTLVFLVSYLYYHHHVGSIPFRGVGWSRPVYFAILLSHTVLAAFVVPLAATLLFHAARGQFDRHRAVARWTLPVWLYVSVTGVLIYCMLYIWFPGP